MWFWINFSPIGQAPPAPKKQTETEDGKEKTAEPEAKLEGLIFRLSTFANDLFFRRKKIK